MTSFRFKLGILLAIIAGAFVVSQVLYRSTVTALHDAVFSAVDTAELVHGAENFHSSVHMMLYLAMLQTERRDKKTAKEYETLRAKAVNAIAPLLTAADAGSGDKGHHDGAAPAAVRAGDLRTLFHAFTAETDAVFSGTDGNAAGHLEKARALFDDIFMDYFSAIHEPHQARLRALKTGAHEMNQRITLLFYGQLAIIVLAAALALGFSNRVLLSLYMKTERHAFSDSLTGLKNRRYLDEVLKSEARELIRRNTPFSLLFADIDRFKVFNDAYGHPAGDKLLTEFADHLRKGVRRADTVVRYGGEEFVALLPGADKTAAVSVAEKIRQQVETAGVMLPSGASGGQITVSIGIASFPDDGDAKFSALLKKADERLYLAKSSGRNRVAC